jgi:V-type H+-transporting ATPase subunit E
MATIVGSDLEAYLHRQARERALNRVAQAEDEARQLLGEATAEIEALRLENERRVAKVVEEKRRRAIAQARLKAKLTLIHRREEIVERLWREAESRLRTPGEAAQRLALLERLLADAAAQLEGGDLQVQANAADRALLDGTALQDMAQWLQSAHGVIRLTLAEDAAPIWGGVIVRRGAELVDSSLNERLAVAKRVLRDTIYHLLAPHHE